MNQARAGALFPVCCKYLYTSAAALQKCGMSQPHPGSPVCITTTAILPLRAQTHDVSTLCTF